MANRLKDLKKIQTLRLPITGEKSPSNGCSLLTFYFMVAVIARYVWHLGRVAIDGLLPEDEEQELSLKRKRA